MDELINAILEVILGPLLVIIGHVLLFLVLYLIIVPTFWVLSTPVVLISAIFGPGDYAAKVAAGYKGICVGVSRAGG